MFCATLPVLLLLLSAQDEAYRPQVEDSSEEGLRSIVRFRVPDGFDISLFAAEPFLANPVCFAFGGPGRIFVAETFRHHAGVTDIRSHMDWLDDDLASRTVEDRVAMIRKHEGERFAEYAAEHDRVRLIEDVDLDGVADRASVFADGFKHPSAGIGAGLLARGDDLYFTCIPSLWRLRDTDADGRADEREALQSGYGVHVGLLGHDLHGLCMGPDGRLYFSIGDRGLHVETAETTIDHGHTGAVLRCEPDGSGLEVFATGLRNPQELVFDDRGDLFTGDNNSDGGDRARFVWVMEGSDSGWRYSYQWITRPNLRGPWNAERMWEPFHAGQPAFHLPPIANVTDGPSGITLYPGSGWDASWNGTFFLCDFRGLAALSGVRTVRIEPRGAGFALADYGTFLSGSLVTDVDFGPDGALYVSDWVQGWDKTGKGRIYRIAPQDHARPAASTILAADLSARPTPELAGWLAHADRRVRLEAQLALAERAREDRDARDVLAGLCTTGQGLARVHAIWGLGLVARRSPRLAAPLLDGLLRQLDDEHESEVRCQLLKVLGDARWQPARGAIADRLEATEPRERLFAALALGRLGGPSAVQLLLELLERNADQDPWLRHAGVRALAWSGALDSLARYADAESVAVRRAVLLAYRAGERAETARFLGDEDAELVAEAARAIYDVPIRPAFEALAERLDMPLPDDEYLLRRVICANVALGGERRAQRIVRWLEGTAGTERNRAEALSLLAQWASPPKRDPVTGAWRPARAARDGQDGFLRDAARRLATPVLARAGSAEVAAWIELVRAAGASDLAPVLYTCLAGGGHGAVVRTAALEVLVALEAPSWREGVRRALRDPEDAVRRKAYDLLSQFEPGEALEEIELALAGAEAPEPPVLQGAFRALAALPGERADRLITRWLEAQRAGALPPEAELELAEAAESRSDPGVREALADTRAEADDDPLATWRPSLRGGDAGPGRRLFFESAELSCLRCHKVGERGTSELGPDLADVGTRLSRAELLESIVLPNRVVSEGYENWILLLADGTLLSGRILTETAELVEVQTEEEIWELDPGEIEARRRDVSAMPDGLGAYLDRSQMRDLVEYLSSLR